MSLDYTCYALSKRPLSPATIAGASPDWLFVFVAGSNRLLHKARTLPSYCLVWGCRRSSRLDLAAVVGTGDRDALSALERRGSVGCCELEVESDFEADPDFLADGQSRPGAKKISARHVHFFTHTRLCK
jgi:hypothetical protein